MNGEASCGARAGGVCPEAEALVKGAFGVARGRRSGAQKMLRFPLKWRPGHSWRSEEMRDDGRGDHRCVRCPTRSHLSGLGLTFPLPASLVREWFRHV
ncbi:hypothetical protein SGR_156 [Streptomyces griseus subsp. griseus NBRC 13350]|uniref:Uncharacterized protein n=1 Tax=Streptomyces griseus subsp. griseus (strain JCM 4626 / CBS 651.72 / NBRC 13350 / KCC S-0626 / ISP 5235) TaxID=455632 RepID=B1VNG2_STRGG|nr:hypothetical protein SGR_156 [Streptomyces griseus subsp. griseus NBRC 13350]